MGFTMDVGAVSLCRPANHLDEMEVCTERAVTAFIDAGANGGCFLPRSDGSLETLRLSQQESCLRLGPWFKELFLAINQSINIVGSQLDIVTMSDCVSGAGFHAVAAEDTTRIINIVNFGITLTSRYAILFGIVASLDVNTICRTSGGAQKTSHAFFETVFVALENMDPAIPGLNTRRHIGVGFGGWFAEHGPQGHTESLIECAEGFADFFND